MKASVTIGMNECCLNTHMFDTELVSSHQHLEITLPKMRLNFFFFFFGILGFAGKKIMSHR